MGKQSRANTIAAWLFDHALVTSAIGYGIICGLTFPLMISSTFLQTMSLSHGAGSSFGALFFIAYGLTMLATSLRNACAKKPHHPVTMRLAFAFTFAGNGLMMLSNLGIIKAGWLYAIVTSGLIGFGLATAEIGWLSRIRDADDQSKASIHHAVPLSFTCGACVAAAIFMLPNFLEIGLALISVLLSAAVFASRKIPKIEREPLSFAGTGMSDMIKAICYLAVFSFVFGAISQVATTTKGDLLPIVIQAILGILLAAIIMLAGARRQKGVLDVSNLYGLLFPIVAVALIALPFTTSPLLHIVSTVLVFVAYYLASVNVRIILCQLSSSRGVSLWVYMGAALGISCFLILAGVGFGANILAQGNPETGLALISLISLFVLALNPIITNRLEKSRPQKPNEPIASSGLPNPLLIDDFGSQFALTPREAEVLKLICQGRTRSYIADELGLSQNTIKGYIHNVYQKTQAVDKQDLLDRVELFVQRQNNRSSSSQ